METISQGSIGEEYRLEDTRLKREVAIKVLPKAISCKIHKQS